jgi:hypothetical protein
MFISSAGNSENLEGVWNMQGDDSKEGKDSKRLSRAELLEMLIEQSKEVESLKKKVDELQKQLDDRTIQLQQTGSIAEAALALNDIFKAADQAASQYIESIKRMEHEKNVEFQTLRQKTLDACAVMREDTQEYCRRLRYESEAKRDALYAQLEKEKEEIEKNNSSEGSDPSTWTRLETSPSVGGGVS